MPGSRACNVNKEADIQSDSECVGAVQTQSGPVFRLTLIIDNLAWLV